MLNTTIKTDYIGALAALLCLLHCIATPFVFIAKANSAYCCEIAPSWWQFIDYVFLPISLYAVYRISSTQKKNWLVVVLWISWAALLLIVMNEKMSFIALPEETIYFPAISLILLHVYNLKYCKCKEEQCCVNSKTLTK